MADWGHLHTWFSRMLFLMFSVTLEPMALTPDQK